MHFFLLRGARSETGSSRDTATACSAWSFCSFVVVVHPFRKATMEVVNAADLLSDTPVAKSVAYKHDDLHYDLGMLRADDTHPVDAPALAADKEGYLQRLTQENTQLLVKHIFEQPIEQTQLGPVVCMHVPIVYMLREDTCCNWRSALSQRISLTFSLPAIRRLCYPR